MYKLINFIDSIFDKLADILILIGFIAIIFSIIYFSYRIQVNITKQAFIESNEKNN